MYIDTSIYYSTSFLFIIIVADILYHMDLLRRFTTTIVALFGKSIYVYYGINMIESCFMIL